MSIITSFIIILLIYVVMHLLVRYGGGQLKSSRYKNLL